MSVPWCGWLGFGQRLPADLGTRQSMGLECFFSFEWDLFDYIVRPFQAERPFKSVADGRMSGGSNKCCSSWRSSSSSIFRSDAFQIIFVYLDTILLLLLLGTFGGSIRTYTPPYVSLARAPCSGYVQCKALSNVNLEQVQDCLQHPSLFLELELLGQTVHSGARRYPPSLIFGHPFEFSSVLGAAYPHL